MVRGLQHLPPTEPVRAAVPHIERHVVELVRALPRHGEAFLEPSRLAPADVRTFLQQALPAAGSAVKLAVFDRVVEALAKHPANLYHADALVQFVQKNAGERLALLAQQLAVPRSPDAVASTCRKLRRLSQLALLPADHALAAKLFGRGQGWLARNGASSLPTRADSLQASRLSHLLQLSPLTRVRPLRRDEQADAHASGPTRFSFVTGPGSTPISGIRASAQPRRGLQSSIKPLLLEDNTEWVDKVMVLEAGRGDDASRMLAADYARQREAGRIAGCKVQAMASFYDTKGDLHDIAPRYDGDLVHLMQANGNHLGHPGLVVHAAVEVLTRLARLHGAGWGHRDIKPDNVLWNRRGDFALTDFATACPFTEMTAQQFTGSQGYIAPEVLLMRSTAAPAADLFALGVTLATLMAPLQMQQVPLYIDESVAAFRDADADARMALASAVDGALDDYREYQTMRQAGAAGGDAALLEGHAYEHLRRALTDVGDPYLASLVVDTLLHADPQRRGDAADILAQLKARYPQGHAIFADNAALLQKSSQACSYTLRMDALYRDMRLYRDGVLRSAGGAVPPPPAETI